jgi:hypothetical protein
MYLFGPPSSFQKKPTRKMLHPVIEKVGNILPSWKKRFFSYLGRELFVKSVLSALPTYFLSVHRIPK